MYRLKMEFGVKADVYKLNSSSTNYDTGTKTRDITKTSVRRAVMMPKSTVRQQYISPNFTQTNKAFITKGLGWDDVTDLFLFDAADLRGYDFDLQDWIVHNHVRYDVKMVEELGVKGGWAVWATLAKNSGAEEFHDQLVEQDIGVDAEVSEVVE